MDFLLQWLWYSLAFIAGSGVGGLVGLALNRSRHKRAPVAGQ